jgi:hypothetical protein
MHVCFALLCFALVAITTIITFHTHIIWSWSPKKKIKFNILTICSLCVVPQWFSIMFPSGSLQFSMCSPRGSPTASHFFHLLICSSHPSCMLFFLSRKSPRV